ncbi:MAG: sensor histidine kinase [Acidimicrobiales bacterium]
MTASRTAPGSRIRARLIDLAWCGATVAGTAAVMSQDGFDAVAVASAAVGVVLIVARRRWPVPVLAVGLVTTFAGLVITGQPSAILFVTMLLVYNVARRTNRTGALWAGATGGVVLGSSVLIVFGGDDAVRQLFSAVTWPALAAAVGDATRSRAEVVANALERAERAERTRDETARRQVVEERLRIARDLHDAVAHHISIANVQAGVARHLLDSDRDGARSALDHVRSATQQVLDDLGDILGVLRSDLAPSPTAPTPTLDDIDELMATATSTGLDIRYRTSGRTRPLPRPVTIAAYRLIQEALTNAHKHGGGHAEVTVAYHPDHLRITVGNQTAPPAAPETAGYGLIGMRERVTAAGGTLEAGHRPGGRFTVDARLPLEPPGSGDERPAMTGAGS